MADRDDLGEAVPLPAAPRRVVSLVPSLTESVAAAAPDLLVGATDYCTHPAGLDVARVGGSKYPRVADVRALEPDLVLANVEENRRDDIAQLRDAGIPVWVTYPRTVPAAVDSLAAMFTALRLPAPDWLDEARQVWSALPSTPPRRAVVPVWRRPWVWLGADTFAADMLARVGVRVSMTGDDRYPRMPVAEALRTDPELAVLPDEPYRFTAHDGPEAFAPLPCALVSGRDLTWYGPSLVTARQALTTALAAG